MIYILNAWKYSAFNLLCESLFSAHSFECREWIHMDKCTVVVRSHSLHLLCMSLEEVPSQLTSTACDFWRFIFQAFIYISKCLHLNGQKLEPPSLPLPKSLATTELGSWMFETLRFRQNQLIASCFPLKICFLAIIIQSSQFSGRLIVESASRGLCTRPILNEYNRIKNSLCVLVWFLKSWNIFIYLFLRWHLF